MGSNPESILRSPIPIAVKYTLALACLSRGIGYIDVHLLASIALSGDGRLWTRDRRLAAVARELDVAFDEGE